MQPFLRWALYRVDALHRQDSVFHVRSYVRGNIDGPGHKKEMDEINLMETLTLTKEQRDFLHGLLKNSIHRPLGILRNIWLMDLVMMFDGTNDKTIIVKGDKNGSR